MLEILSHLHWPAHLLHVAGGAGFQLKTGFVI